MPSSTTTPTARGGGCGPLPDAPPPSIRLAVPRGVPGSLGRPRLADQRHRRALASRRDRRRPPRRARSAARRRRAATRPTGGSVSWRRGVVPVAGLIAETGATLREEQFELAARARSSRRRPSRRTPSLGRPVPGPGAEPARRRDPRGAARASRPVRPAPGRRAAGRRPGRAPPPSFPRRSSSGPGSRRCSGSWASGSPPARTRSRRARRWQPCAWSATSSGDAPCRARTGSRRTSSGSRSAPRSSGCCGCCISS